MYMSEFCVFVLYMHILTVDTVTQYYNWFPNRKKKKRVLRTNLMLIHVAIRALSLYGMGKHKVYSKSCIRTIFFASHLSHIHA